MRKAFDNASKGGETHPIGDQKSSVPLSNPKNYTTPAGFEPLIDERRFLLARERPAVTKVVAWAASNGDRSENADYQYNKRRLRQIDRRIRYLTQQLDAPERIDPENPPNRPAPGQIFFGANVREVQPARA